MTLPTSQPHAGASDRWILSLDGGGVRGLMTAVFLKRLEREIGLPLANCFDLIAGTSSGAVIAGGLAIGPSGTPVVQLRDLVAFFHTDSPKIFSQTSAGFLGTLRWLLGPLHDTDRLHDALVEKSGKLMLSSVSSNLLVTAYDMRRGEPVMFQSWLAGRAQRRPDDQDRDVDGLIRFCPRDADGFADIELATALTASAAVPTYFSPVRHSRDDGDHYALVDGFVYALNPALPAYFAGQRLFGRNARLKILSLGTGKATAGYDWADLKRRGAARWLKPMLEAFPDGASDASATYLDWMAESGDVEHIRINPSFAGLSEKDTPAPGFDDASRGNLEALAAVGGRLFDDNRNRIDGLVHQLRAHAAESAAQMLPSG